MSEPSALPAFSGRSPQVVRPTLTTTSLIESADDGTFTVDCGWIIGSETRSVSRGLVVY